MNSFFVSLRRVFSLLSFFAVVGFLPTVVLAQAESAAQVAGTAGFGDADLTSIIGTVINVFLGLLGVIFLVLVIYAGFRWMTAGGDQGQVDKAKRILINATVGLVITLMAYAIATFIINALTGGGDGAGTTPSGTVSIEPFSGALGGGAIQDHYPFRNQTDVPRNTNIVVTFRRAMDVASFIEGYDNGGTPTDITDDNAVTGINSDKVKIYLTTEGKNAALTDVAVSFTEDLRTFVFNPTDYLGSPTNDVSYTVFLDDNLLDAEGVKVFSGIEDHYEWSFVTGVSIDTEPPQVVAVTPSAGGTYAKNIAVQITFNEPIDPTSSTGIRLAASGFDNIQVAGASSAPEPGTYAISNGYETITFTTSNLCGTNSCGEDVYCLPGNETITATVGAATPGVSPPTTDLFPFDGVVDMAANSLDGNGDGEAGDDYGWSFLTTDDIFLSGAKITSISPDINESNVALDQSVTMIFDSILLSSTVNNENISFNNTELTSGQPHEMWYRFDSDLLTAAGDAVLFPSQVPSQTSVSISHGVFLESVDGKTYLYGVEAMQGIKNQYQNCYRPAEGPDATGGQCGVSQAAPYCCNGVASTTNCTLF